MVSKPKAENNILEMESMKQTKPFTEWLRQQLKLEKWKNSSIEEKNHSSVIHKWKISQFTRKQKQTRKKTTTTIKSGVFYTKWMYGHE